MTSRDRVKDMMTRLRPMAVFNSGVWQRAEGVWLDIENYKARCLLNGKELICDGRSFIDLDSLGESDIYSEITKKNIATLPRQQQKKSRQIAFEPPRFRESLESRLPQYRVIRRNGLPHAVPNPHPADLEMPSESVGHQIVIDIPYIPPPEPLAGNNA